MTASPTPVDRKKFGPLADDIVLLRSDGRVVAPFKGGFRVDHNPEIFSAVDIARLAHELHVRRNTVVMCAGWEKRAKREHTPERAASLPQGKPDQFVSKAADAGRPMPGGFTETTDETPSGGGAGTAEITGGLGSASAKAINESCGGVEGHAHQRAMQETQRHVLGLAPAQQAPEKSEGSPAGFESGPQDTITDGARIAALEARVVALEAALADYKSLVRVAVVELIAMVKAERRR